MKGEKQNNLNFAESNADRKTNGRYSVETCFCKKE